MVRQACAFVQWIRQRGQVWERWSKSIQEKLHRVRRLWTMARWRRRLRVLEQRRRFCPEMEMLEVRTVPTGYSLTAFQLTNDPVNSLQTTIAEATVTPGTGSVMLSQPLNLNVTPGSSFGSPNLVYNSSTVNDMPVIEAELTTDSGSPLPTIIYMELSIWNAAGGATSTYSENFYPSGSPGETLLMGVQAGAFPFSTGLYDWSMGAYANNLTSSPVAVTTGQAVAIDGVNNALGAGWGLSGVDSLDVVDGGSEVIWATGTGQERLYVSSSPGVFTNPEDFGSLVESSSGGTNTFTYTAVDQSESIFNVSNQSSNVYDLAQVIDTGHGLTENLTYDTSDRLTEIANPDGSSATFAYGASSVTITEPGGDSVVLNLNGSNDLTSIVDGAGFTRSLTYNDHEVTTDSWAPFSTSFSYDGDKLLSGVTPSGRGTNSITSAEALSLEPPSSVPTQVNTEGLIVTTVDSVGDTTTYAVDERDRLEFEKTPLGNTDSFLLSDTTETAPTQYGSGLETEFIDAVGDITSFGYDSSGSLTEEISPNGGITLYRYGGSYHELTTTSQELSVISGMSPTTVWAVTEMSYNTSDDMTEEISPNGNTEYFSYSAGLLTSTTDALGNITDLTYNGNRQLTGIDDYNPGATLVSEESMSYDTSGNMTLDIVGGVDTDSMTYDGDRNLTGQIDTSTGGTASDTSDSYDAAGLLVQSLTGSDYKYFTYDAYGSLVSQSDYLLSAAFSGFYDTIVASTVSDSYNSAEELTLAVTGNSDSVSYTYNSDGMVTTQADTASGNTASYQSFAYDSDDRVTDQYEGSGTVITDSFSYDSDSNQTSQSDMIGAAVASTDADTYDLADRLIQQVIGSDTTSYTYDSDSNQVAEAEISGGVTAFYQSDVYDSDDRLVQQITGPDTDAYTYDAAGNLLTQTDYTTSGATTQTASYTSDSYNLAGQMLLSVLGTDSFAYTYDGDGNMLTETDYAGADTALYVSDSYNEADQLVQSVTGSDTVDYTLDADGNTLTQADIAGGSTASYTSDSYNQADQLVSSVVGTDSFIYTYDADGNMLTQVDSGGFSTASYTSDSYNLAGQMVLSAHGTDTSAYTYDADGNMLTETDYMVVSGTTDTASYTSDNYNGADQLVQSVRGSDTFAYSYDGAGNQLTETDDDVSGGSTDTADYASDSYNLAGQEVLAVNGSDTVASTFDADGNLLTETDYVGANTASLTSDTYNQAGQLIQSVRGPNTFAYTLDADGNLLTEVDYTTSGATTATASYTSDSYNEAGQLLLSVRGTDSFAYTYDADGDMLTETDYVGAATASYTSDSYNQADQMVQSVQGTETTAYTLDADGNVLTQTECFISGFTTTTATFDSDSYNLAGQMVLSVRGFSDSMSYTYDADGNMLTEADVSSGSTASFTSDSYNLAGQMVMSAHGSDTAVYTLDADGNMLTETDYMVVSGTTDTASVTSDSYNSAGQLLYSVNGVGDTTAYSYDADGNTVQEVDGYGTTDSATTQYQDDLAGGRTAIIDPAGDTTNFSLNADGQTVGMTEDLGTSTSSEAYTYNLAGQLVTTIDENGGTEAYVNDADGRVTSETWYNSGGTAVESFSYSYDEAGNMLTAMNTQGTDTFSYSFTYNAAGEVLTVSEPFGVSLSFGYNLAGERTTVSDSFGGSESLTYDADGDLTSLTYNVSGSTVSMNFTYNQAGQQTQESMYYNFGLIATVSESHDADGDVLKIVDTNTSAATIDSFSYAYDLANEVTTESDYSGASTSYTYNAAGELINAGTQTYNYDAAGDADSTGDNDSGGNEQTSFVDPATGDTLDYTYDNAGNELTKTDTNTGITWTYGYNNANQVVTATETNSSSVTQEVVNYEYDAFGNLLKETTTPYVSGVAGSSTVTEFAVDGWNPAKSTAMGDSGFDTWAVMNGSGALQTRNIIGNQIDQILARIDNATNGASDPSGAYFTLTDKNGSVRDVLNSTANAAPVDVISYDAWGNILSQTSSNGSVTTPSDYLGHYSWDGYDYDTADSLYLDHARIYDAASQRWMSQDPMGYDAGDSNLYRYVNNAPTNATDPSGDFTIELSARPISIPPFTSLFNAFSMKASNENGKFSLQGSYSWTPVGLFEQINIGRLHLELGAGVNIKAELNAEVTVAVKPFAGGGFGPLGRKTGFGSQFDFEGNVELKLTTFVGAKAVFKFRNKQAEAVLAAVSDVTIPAKIDGTVIEVTSLQNPRGGGRELIVPRFKSSFNLVPEPQKIKGRFYIEYGNNQKQFIIGEPDQKKK